MKYILAACLMLVSFDAMAIQRYNSSGMSCARVRAILSDQGAAILRYPAKHTPGLQLYGRYVRDARWCDRGEYAASVSVPAADTRSCPVFECRRIEGPDDLFIWPRR
ncbi:MAG: hypothetical protein J0H34_14485 [Rhizobiales bacterium]|nr:hypothetical protein [Hyphomicrobiales bacterium]